VLFDTIYRQMDAPSSVTGTLPVAPIAQQAIDAGIEYQVNKGLDKYGTLLQTFNGRNAAADVLQELTDLLMYTTQQSLEYSYMQALLYIIAITKQADNIIPHEFAMYLRFQSGLSLQTATEIIRTIYANKAK
jgi:hypothetical protein